MGFVKGRFLCENVLLAAELVSDFNKEGEVTRGCLQIDISKAYDKVDWSFILNILEALELPMNFIYWIKLCISSPHYSVSINGELAGFFKGKKGLRQGDPISSSLFVLAMDILSKLLDKEFRNGNIGPHPLCMDPLVTHLSFADDVLIFFDGSQNSLGGILQVLTEFEKTSGLAMNLKKSCLFLDGNKVDTARQLASAFRLVHGSLPVRYLGLPLMSHKLRPQDYQPLIDKVRSRICSWTARQLSFAGRLQLIQSVLFSLINFWASSFLLPKSCLDTLEKLCNSFLWNGSPETARGAKVSWESVCSPKNSGGLGLRRLEDMNQVFGLKLIWLLFASKGSLWVAWIEKNIIRGRLFWAYPLQLSGSWIWRRLMKLRELARPHLFCKINSGSSALFWHDDWTNLGPLIDLTGANGPRVTGIDKMATVSQVCLNGSWSLSPGRHPILRLLRDCLPPEIPSSLNQDSDVFFWRNSPNTPPGEFSSSETWNSIHPPSPEIPWTQSVWFKDRIPKHAFILWIVMKDRLITRDRLRSWGLNVPSNCLLCDSSPETKIHLFTECAYSLEVWDSFFNHQDLPLPNSLDEIVLWCKSPTTNVKVNTICLLLVQAIVYCLWRERNSRIHTTITKPSNAITKEIQVLLRAKLFGLDRASNQIRFVPPTDASSSSTNGSFLQNWFRYFQG